MCRTRSWFHRNEGGCIKVPEKKQLILKTRSCPRMISFFSVLPVKYRTHYNEFFLYLFHPNLNIRAHKPGCSGTCHRYEVSRPSLLVQNPTFPGLGLGPEEFSLKPEVRGTRSTIAICFVGNISGTMPMVSSQCFPLAGIAASSWSSAVIWVYLVRWMIFSLVCSFMKGLPFPFG